MGDNPITGNGYSNWDMVLTKVVQVGSGERLSQPSFDCGAYAQNGGGLKLRL